MRKLLLVAISSFLLGGAFMYLVDTTWIKYKAESNRNQFNAMKIQYSNALDVSSTLVNNCYDAFYTISKCSTKEGCSFESTIYSLIKLNHERKILKLKLDHLLENNDALWSRNPHFDLPGTPNFSPSKI